MKHEQDTPIDISTDGSDATPTEAPDFPLTPTKLPIVEPKSTSRKSLVILLILLSILSLGGGSAFAYYTLQANKPQPVVKVVTTPTPLPAPKPLVADALLYETSVPGKNVGTCSTSTSTLYRQPISGEAAAKVLDVPDYQEITHQIVRNKQVVIETGATCASKAGSQLWISSDSGNTFTKLYELPSKSDSVTSINFSNDSKSIVIGALSNASKTNTIQTIDITTKKVTDLFTLNKEGVYLLGYDVKNQKIYYYTSPCFGCDAGSYETAWAYDLAKKTETKLFDADKDSIIYNLSMSSDLSKILRLQYTGTTSPKGDYTVDEYTVTTNKVSPVAKFTKTTANSQAHSGYTNDGDIYYSFDKSLYSVSTKTNTPSLIMTPTNTLANVFYADKNKVIVELGDNTVSAQVVLYNIGDKSTSKLLDYKYPSSISGVVLK